MKKAALMLCTVALGLGGFFNAANAEVLYTNGTDENLISTGTYVSSGPEIFLAGIPGPNPNNTGNEWQIHNIYVAVQRQSSAATWAGDSLDGGTGMQTWRAVVYEYTGGTVFAQSYSFPFATVHPDEMTADTQYLIQFSTSTPLTLDPANGYSVFIWGDNAAGNYEWPAISGGCDRAAFTCYQLYGSTNNAATAARYVVVEGLDEAPPTPPADDTTRITDVVSPANGGTTLTTTVTFEYDYFFNDDDFGTTTQACAYITDVTVSQQLVPQCDPILASGTSTYLRNRVLTEGHMYLWRPVLLNDDNIVTVSAPTRSFFVVSNPGGISLIPADTATSSIQGWFGAGVGALGSVAPFSYYMQLRNAQLSAVLALGSSTTSLPVATIVIASTTQLHIEAPLFDREAMEGLLGADNVETAKGLIALIAWLMFGTAVTMTITGRIRATNR